MNNKKQIRLTESDLKQIVKESVIKILKESEGLNATPYLNTNEFDRGFNPSQDKNDEINASWEAIDQEYGTPDIVFNDPYCSDANKLEYMDNGMTNGIYPLDDLSNPNVIDDDNYRSFWSYNDKISPKYFRKNESKNMNKKLIRLTENDLHKIVKESAKRIMKEVALKGKSGKTYSLQGNDEESWDIMTNLRQNQKGGHGVTQYNTSRNAKNAEEMDAKNHPNRRSLNNANRVKASLKRTSDASKDIMAANESKLSRIVKESVNRIIKENSKRNKRIIKEFDDDWVDDDWVDDDYCEYDDPLKGCPYDYDELMNDPELQREYPEAYDYFLGRDHQGDYNGWNEF